MLSNSMRQNYNTHGVDDYYKIVGKTYRNPHFPGIQQTLWVWMNIWWEQDGRLRYMRPTSSQSPHDLAETSAETMSMPVTVLDMAAGSGEVTIALREWWISSRMNHASQSTSLPPSELPTTSTPNPSLTEQHRLPSIRRSARNAKTPSKFAFGSDAPKLRVLATDPYTSDAYLERTGQQCHPLSFKDISEGNLASIFETSDAIEVSKVDKSGDTAPAEESEEATNAVDTLGEMVICSFALHLIETPSELWALLMELSWKFRWLVILAPHKKPEMKDGWGWALWDPKSWREAESIRAEDSAQILLERVHCRVYRSTNI
jgi:hypothetical protein